MNDLKALFAHQRAAFRVNPMPAAEQRIQWLRGLRDLLFNEQVSLIRAISEDFSNRSADETLLGEIMPSLHGIHYAAKRVRKRMLWLCCRSA
jgi:coniferyl-aldehyde dehydrogenase